MSSIQRATTIHVSEDSESSETLENFQSRPCGWCKSDRALKNGEKFCKDCYDASYRICSRCKIPYPSAKYFSESDSSRCNPCHKKYLKERELRENKKRQQQQQQQQGSDLMTKKQKGADGRVTDVTPVEQPCGETPKKKQRTTTFSSSSSSSSSFSPSDEEDGEGKKNNSRIELLQTMLLESLQSEIDRKKKNKKRKKMIQKKRIQHRKPVF